MLNSKQTNDGIFSNKAEENFNLAKKLLNVESDFKQNLDLLILHSFSHLDS